MYVDILFGVSHFHIEVFMELKKKKKEIGSTLGSLPNSFYYYLILFYTQTQVCFHGKDKGTGQAVPFWGNLSSFM